MKKMRQSFDVKRLTRYIRKQELRSRNLFPEVCPLFRDLNDEVSPW
ncbi:hypothetical protein BIFGAL_02827 [Bifidobacterium gallicum DSM 20093 = LMG 11596]|uniref:Uncharacterized protein n=1 Tax=Bifidobacterium gallicum DSM 20093 = LMG 11596 TaxID=561180 RepID=D1NSR7_9BIFI|nr:hypothetical protein BIFGAL_02827 [Bifidobacterium gallicum DSM 20093 = LMG 11596]